MTNEDYAKRAVELGGGILSTMEHGYQGRYIEGYNLAKQYNLKFLFGAEAYWVKDRTEKDKSNCHIFIGAKNENGRQAMNDVLSEANISGFYGQPRLDIPLILSLPKDDVWVTTACVAYWKYEDIESITKDFADHFGKNFYLEVQYHNTEKQAELNRRILRMHDSLKIPIIMGCDSHYIFPGDAQNRTDFLLSKDMRYSDEEGWYLDYPDGDTAYERFAKQSVLSDREIREAMDNTNIFLDVEEYDNQIFNTKIKMPSLYPDWTQEQKDEEYKRLVYKGWDNYKTDVPKERWPEYEEQIASEVQTVIDTKMSDYFIDNYHIIKKGKENGGWLTKSGRGSAVSFLTNKLLGFTEVDRVGAKVKMYPERFMSTTRILQSGSLADIDFNISPVEPFAKAQQEVLGEDHAYPMVSYGTMQVSAAWKLYAKSQGVPFEIANAISDQVRKYELALKHADEDEKDTIVVENYIDKQYLDIFNKSSDYRGLITSWSIAPCSYLLYEGSIRKEVGLVQVKDHLCCLMDGHWAEENHFLKNDLLKVSVVDLIYRTYKKLGMEPPSVNELLTMCPPEDPAWDVYKRGCTMGINQVEKSGTSARVRNYHPTNVSELCAFVAAIRPGFASMYKTFENRTPFSYNIKAFDNLIQTPEMPNTFVLYQEMEMAVLNYAGIPMDECYTAIKNIAKKRVDKVLAYKEQFMNGFKSAIIAEDGRSDEDAEALAEKLWQIIEDSSRYSFNACLSGDTQIRQIVRANCGGQPSLDAIYKIKTHADGIEDDWTPFWMERHGGHGKPKAWSLCRDGEIRKNDIKDVRDSGIQDLYRVTLSSGDYIDCTLEHKFPTPRGIRKLSMLKTGCILYKMGESPDDPVEELPIISIEYIGKGQTYDVEMGHMAHNFALQNGIITSNSHSYCVAIDSLYGAWLKAHHPLEFYQTYLEVMEEKGDKDKMNAAKLEAEDYFNIKFLPFRFDQDNRSVCIDKEHNTITNKLSAIKSYSDLSAKLLYECSQEHYESFIDVLRWLDAHSFKSSKIIPLIKIDYFQMYGNNRELLRVVEIWDMLSQGTAKKIKKDKLSPEITNIVKDYATDKGVRGNELASWTITDMDGLLKKFESIVMSSGFEDLDYKTKAFNQNEILGYVDMTTGLEEDRFKLYVLDVYPLEDKFNGGIWLFKVNTKSIGSGKTCCLSLKPNVMSKKHITSGSIINVSKREDLYKDKKGYWWLADYDVIS